MSKTNEYIAIPIDIMEDAEELTNEEFGSLVRFMAHYMETGDDSAELTGAAKYFRRRVTSTLDRIAAARQTAQENGLRGGRPKKEKTEQKPDENQTETEVKPNQNLTETETKPSKNQAETEAKPNGNQTETEAKANQKPKTKTKTKTKDNNPPISPLRGEYTADFEHFWGAYPRKEAKKTAFAAWKKIKPDALTVHKMLKALEVQKQSDQWHRENGQYIPHPATWLNQERWNDEPPDIRAPARYGCESRPRGEMDAVIAKLEGG